MSERRASMGDKVYRGDVVKYIRNHISLETFMHRTVKKADEACWNLCDQLNFVPAIEEEPTRMKGRWERVHPSRSKSYLRFCSVCREQCWYCGTGDYDFCPNCGADMRGEEDE